MSITNQQKYSVYYLSDSGSTPAKIAKELGLTTKEVKDILSSRNTEKTNSKIKTTSAPVNSKDLMITETSVKGNKTVSIMTKAASEVNDAFRQNMPSDVSSRTTRNAIYRPNQNK